MARIKKAQDGKKTPDSTGYYSRKLLKAYGEKDFAGAKKASADVARQSKKGKPGYDASGFPIKKKAAGGKLSVAKGGKEMIKRADGSVSQRGLWDNIRANKGSGKKPTAAMLKQEKKIKAKSKK